MRITCRALSALSNRTWQADFVILLATAGIARGSFFDAHELISFTLEAPISELYWQRGAGEKEGKGPIYLDSRITYIDPTLGDQTLDVRVKARGRLRRRPETCSFPPLWLNFKKKQVTGTLFEGLDKVKLVTHCQGDASFQQIVVKEFLIYRTFNLLTDRSFRVRLARITYKDMNGMSKPRARRYGFFIEAEKALGKRIGGKIVKANEVNFKQYDPAALNLASVFQYMIGNTDYGLLGGPAGERCCHNGRPFRFPDPSAPFIPVPYDFDLAGIINAPYANPDPHFGLKSVRERFYRGFCHEAGILEGTIEVFDRHRPEITALWNTQVELKPNARKAALSYIGSFYSVIDDPKKRKRQIESKCR